MEIVNFATLKDVELFRPGNHNGLEFSESDIDTMIESSNACLPFIKQSIKDKGYRENPNIVLTKQIPNIINIAHQKWKWFNDRLRESIDDIAVEFSKKGHWLTATLKNVPDDLGEIIQDLFSLRSIELIPELKNPLDGKVYKNVIRSIGFLPSGTRIEPAISGQNPQFALEYAEDSFITLYSQPKQPPKQEEITMAEETKVKTPVAQPNEGVSLQEFQELKNSVLEMKKRAEQAEMKQESLQKENEALEAMLNTEIKKAEAKDIQNFCKALESERIQDKHGNQFIVSQSFVDVVSSIIPALDNKSVVEFAEDRKETAREAVQGLIKSVVEMAANGSLVVPVGIEMYQQYHRPPEEQEAPKPMKERVLEFYGAEAKAKAKNPEDANEVYLLALDDAARDSYKRLNNKGGK